MNNLPAWFGIAGFLLLAFAPGAWITFGLTLDEVPVWGRISMAVLLSPLVVCAEFYAVRLLGVPFGSTALLLVFLNLPALIVVWKRRAAFSRFDPGDLIIPAAAVIISVVCMISLLIKTDVRIYSPNDWYHADAVNLFARGQLVLEDPTLAGMRLSYPVYIPLAFQAVQSFLLNSPPLSSYIWSNLLWLIVAYGFAGGIAREMGGGKLAQVCAGIFLFIGVNPVGYIMRHLLPQYMNHELWGDPRYDQWVCKFLLASPMALALAMLMAVIYLLIRPGPLTRSYLVLTCLLVSGIGIFYPLALPSTCGIVAARALAPIASRPKQWPFPRKELLAWTVILLLAMLLTFGEIKFLTYDRRVVAKAVLFSTPVAAVRKILESLIVTSVLLAGVAFTIRACWKSRRFATQVLLGGALASYFLYVAFTIPFFANEYKFIFPIAMCLGVFPSLAVERIWREWPRARAMPALAMVALLVAGTYVYWAWVTWPSIWSGPRKAGSERHPSLEVGGFYLRLDPGEKWSGVCTAILKNTPPDSILLLNNSELDYPAFTNRSLYVPYENRLYWGVNLFADTLDGDLRGYGLPLISQRRAVLTQFFTAPDDSRREQALDVILALKRPVAIVAEASQSNLLEWLQHRRMATELYAGNGLTLWLIARHTGP